MKYSYKELVDLLCAVGIELSAEKKVDALLNYILNLSMKLTGADAGSIYKVEKEGDKQVLEFKFTENHSVNFPFKAFQMPLDLNSIAGACAIHKRVYNFNDMEETISVLGLKHQKQFDERIGYHTQNMLVIPLLNYEGDCIGVMQLINKKSDTNPLRNPEDYQHLIPFDELDAELIRSLGSQTAILIERQELYKNIKKLIESLTETLSKAIDQRDPITGGHSQRVAKYCLDLAQFIHEKDAARYPYTEDELRELYIAGLLHDVGKIGVPEYLLQKADKLSKDALEVIRMRFKYFDTLNKYHLLKTSHGIDSFDDLFLWIKNINHSGFLKDEDEKQIKALAELTMIDISGESLPLLTFDELEQLTIKRGNLTPSERHIIQSHVLLSYELLKDILWTHDLEKVPTIAVTHHEKLTGDGYPFGKSAEALDVSSRVIAIADIYDALTAADRPYKPALPIDKSLNILSEEADKGHLDRDLVNHFIEMIRS